MSQENLRVIEHAVAAVNERDIDGYLACCTEDIVLQTPLAEVVGAYEGPDAFLHTTGSGRVSGVPMNTRTANVYDFAAGKIKRVQIFLDRREALEAVGHSE